MFNGNIQPIAFHTIYCKTHRYLRNLENGENLKAIINQNILISSSQALILPGHICIIFNGLIFYYLVIKVPKESAVLQHIRKESTKGSSTAKPHQLFHLNKQPHEHLTPRPYSHLHVARDYFPSSISNIFPLTIHSIFVSLDFCQFRS